MNSPNATARCGGGYPIMLCGAFGRDGVWSCTRCLDIDPVRGPRRLPSTPMREEARDALFDALHAIHQGHPHIALGCIERAVIALKEWRSE